MGRFYWRRYRAGDEAGINALYRDVAGRQRSLSQFRWQWLEGPAGPGDIFVIVDGDDDEKIIGHHGVMPLRFTFGDRELLFGKIENTMVSEACRSKLLYPRFEKRFKDSYENRYHALFATMGPSAAIRVRRALGYTFPAQWRTLLVATTAPRLFATGAWLATKVLARVGFPGERDEARLHRRLLSAGFLAPEDEQLGAFFVDFWREARRHHGIAPRRDIEDLSWKFWSNPYRARFTYVIDDGACRGFAIVSVHMGVVTLDDWAIERPSQHGYRILLRQLCRSLSDAGVTAFSVTTTSDACQRDFLVACEDRRLPYVALGQGSHRRKTICMPRLITTRGLEQRLEPNNWMVTGMLFEGR